MLLGKCVCEFEHTWQISKSLKILNVFLNSPIVLKTEALTWACPQLRNPLLLRLKHQPLRHRFRPHLRHHHPHRFLPKGQVKVNFLLPLLNCQSAPLLCQMQPIRVPSHPTDQYSVISPSRMLESWSLFKNGRLDVECECVRSRRILSISSTIHHILRIPTTIRPLLPPTTSITYRMVHQRVMIREWLNEWVDIFRQQWRINFYNFINNSTSSIDNRRRLQWQRPNGLLDNNN